jgi:hypothetical protein
MRAFIFGAVIFPDIVARECRENCDEVEGSRRGSASRRARVEEIARPEGFAPKDTVSVL